MPSAANAVYFEELTKFRSDVEALFPKDLYQQSEFLRWLRRNLRAVATYQEISQIPPLVTKQPAQDRPEQ